MTLEIPFPVKQAISSCSMDGIQIWNQKSTQFSFPHISLQPNRFIVIFFYLFLIFLGNRIMEKKKIKEWLFIQIKIWSCIWKLEHSENRKRQEIWGSLCFWFFYLIILSPQIIMDFFWGWFSLNKITKRMTIHHFGGH